MKLTIKSVAFEDCGATQLVLRFSDNSWGIYDFAPFIAEDTEMTRPLKDPAFFRSFFIERGALAWPNGFDLSAKSLRQTLTKADQLHRNAEAA
jgi:hypothetical protein